jgi:hypothetical protein
MSNTNISAICLFILVVGKFVGWWPDLTDTEFALLGLLLYAQDIAKAVEKMADNSSRSTVVAPGPAGPMGPKGEPGKCKCEVTGG